MDFSEYTIKSVEETLKSLTVSEGGLSGKEAGERLKMYGRNEVKNKEIGLFDIFIRQFKSPFFYLLVFAALIAYAVGEKIDSFVIFVFIAINTLLGFFQEARAVKATAILKKYVPSNVRVKRGGKEETIEKEFLVNGDIVLLEAGNIVPADLRVVKVENFLVDESVLSGESVPVAKNPDALLQKTKEIFEAKNILFTGTSVISGEAEGVVVGTGKQTVFGEITKLAAESVHESIYEKNILNFSRLILRIVVVSITVLFVANLILRGTRDLSDFLIFCIAMVVSIIPEALPVVATFSLSQGAIRMAKKKVIVKRLAAVEDLGNIEILCSDKTGTLTEGKLSLEDIFSADKEKCFIYGLLSSSFIEEEIESSMNPFDDAFLKKANNKIKTVVADFKELHEIPFDNKRWRNSVLVKGKSGKNILIVRGAPEVLLRISSGYEKGPHNKDFIQVIEKEIEKAGKRGKRTLAVAYKYFDAQTFSEEDENNLTFLGFFSFVDPPKKTAKAAVDLAKKLNVSIKIITGDSWEVAGAIAHQIGLIDDPNRVILGKDLESLDENEFLKKCEEFQVFARISPETKFRIVESLQKKFEVGFLGEGINDAPALKTANVAIVVKDSADISRGVSDIILLEKDLRVIIDGIGEGRNIFSNINKYIKCTLASNFGNFYSIAVISLFLKGGLPMMPIQILLVNLLSDFPLISVATDKVDAEELKKPKFYQLHHIVLLIVLLASVSTVFDFLFFGIFHKAELPVMQTLWFIESILTEIALIFSVRTRRFFLKAGLPSLPVIILSVFALIATISLPFTAFGQRFFHFVRPPVHYLLIVLLLVLTYFVLSEIMKLSYFRYYWKNGKIKQGCAKSK